MNRGEEGKSSKIGGDVPSAKRFAKGHPFDLCRQVFLSTAVTNRCVFAVEVFYIPFRREMHREILEGFTVYFTMSASIVNYIVKLKRISLTISRRSKSSTKKRRLP